MGRPCGRTMCASRRTLWTEVMLAETFRAGGGGCMARQRTGATLSDVARLAGVSVATASKALNARDEVAASARQRVLQAADELSFQPNVLARGLVSGNTRTIGVLTDELAAARFTIPILVGAENALGNE